MLSFNLKRAENLAKIWWISEGKKQKAWWGPEVVTRKSVNTLLGFLGKMTAFRTMRWDKREWDISSFSLFDSRKPKSGVTEFSFLEPSYCCHVHCMLRILTWKGQFKIKDVECEDEKLRTRKSARWRSSMTGECFRYGKGRTPSLLRLHAFFTHEYTPAPWWHCFENMQLPGPRPTANYIVFGEQHILEEVIYRSAWGWVIA